MKQYYECHITMQGDPVVLRPLVEELGWIFSAIDGDPTLGPGVKCYATRHFHVKQATAHVVDKVDYIAGQLKKSGVDVLRRKVELVVYDHREHRSKDV